MAAPLPRGIAPDLLVSQVKNTMPYLFEGAEVLVSFPPAQVLRAVDPQAPLSHFEYFRLCLSSHYLSCATPVPTDVDNQIRHKLWPAHLDLETALEMSQLVLDSRRWDFTLVTRRFVVAEPSVLSGHLGEWFTVAAAAYCAMRQYRDPRAAARGDELFAEIGDEVRRHSEVFGALWRASEGIACLKASAAIAHNLGDLDRVMDMWELPVGDRLRLDYYGLGTTPFDSNGKLRHMGRLWTAGQLYKSPIEGSAMALENHRHFALRKPRALRHSLDLLIPTGPFLDEWGERVVAAVGAASEDSQEIIAALKHGSERMPKTVGYGRALRGFGITTAQKSPQAQFEKKWHDEALKHLDDIPSRA